jgi:ABC-type uncharacterized transport system permease subunit
MKYIAALSLLTAWMILTIILACTVLGFIFILAADDNNEWFNIPKRILKVFDTETPSK